MIRIVIPAHNEEARIRPTLIDYCEHFATTGRVVVVVNGSSDATLSIVQELQQTYRNLAVIDIPAAVGKGGAVRAGFKTGDEEYVGFVDADNSTAASEFGRLLEICATSGASGVVGSRWMRGSSVSPKQPWKRRFASRGFNAFGRVALGLNFRDTQCGAKIFRRESLRSVLDALALANFAFDIDLLLALTRAGHRVLEVPTVWADKATGSSVRLVASAFSMARALMWLSLRNSPVARIPFFEFIANDARMAVRDELRLLICADVPPKSSQSPSILEDLVERWTREGHRVDWVSRFEDSKRTSAKCAVRLANSLRLLAWYIFTDRRYDAIIEMAEAKPSLISRVATKPRIAIGTMKGSLKTSRERSYTIAADSNDHRASVTLPNGHSFIHEGSIADLVINIARTPKRDLGSFTLVGDDVYKISFRDLDSGRPSERILHL